MRFHIPKPEVRKNFKKLKSKFPHKHYWWYILVSKPDLYLFNLIKNTLITGFFSLIAFFLFERYGNHVQAVPTAFHSLISFVLAMVLVFRTNTAYDRWWKARELFSNLQSTYIYMISLIKSKSLTTIQIENYRNLMIRSLNNIYGFLVLSNNDNQRKDFFNNMYEIQKQNSEIEFFEMDAAVKENIDTFTQLQKILDTPIPTSYSLHIKLSIFSYLFTLPFGMFYIMGYWSVPLVMILYYIIAGVELISNEIENPFKGDPNDLPVQKYLDEIKEEIESELK